MLHLHSVLRYAVLILLLAAIVKAFAGWFGKKEFTSGDQKTGLWLMMSAHIQLVIGLVLYFMNGWAAAPMAESMKNAAARFWKVEHIGAMIIAIALITVGRIMTKKSTVALVQHKRSVIFYTLALILILWAIPWADRGLF